MHAAVDIRAVDDPAAIAGELLAGVSGNVALSGGSTVGRAYDLAAALEPDWQAVDVWFGDERVVPPDDGRSNFLLASERLLDRLARAPRAVHRVETELGAEAAAERYDDALRGVTLSFALNGIGADGHTASLFPHAPALSDTARRAVAAEPALEPLVERVTLTRPMFAQAELLVFLVAGSEKADAVRRAFRDDPTPATPASLVRGRRTIALLDGAAAAAL